MEQFFDGFEVRYVPRLDNRDDDHLAWIASSRASSLLSIGSIFVVTTIILHPIGCTAVTTIILHAIGYVIIGGGEGGWSWGVPKRKWRGINVGAVIFMYILFFLGVADDNNVVVVTWP
jgi:hypothetical protein